MEENTEGLNATRPCTYCGRVNDLAAMHCPECGTAAPPAEEAPVEPQSAALNAKSAWLILAIYILAQFVGGLGLAMTMNASFTESVDPDAGQVARHSQRRVVWMAPALLVVVVGSGLAMMVASKKRVRPYLADTSPTGAAWVRGPSRLLGIGLGTGIFAAMLYVAMTYVIPPNPDIEQYGPLAKMGMTPGIQQVMWVCILLTAPFFEELLFRGVLYGGFRQSYGPGWAASLTTGIFWVLHLQEMIHYWPSMILIAGLALLALWFRVRAAAIGPAVALHFGYNAVLGVVTLVSTGA